MEEINLGEIYGTDFKGKNAEDLTAREIEILLLRLEREIDYGKRLAFEKSVLKKELEKVSRQKVREVAKPLKPSRVTFKDLLDKILEIHLAEYDLVSYGKGHVPLIEKDKAAIECERLAELIVLATTYLEKMGVDEKGRVTLFKELEAKRRDLIG